LVKIINLCLYVFNTLNYIEKVYGQYILTASLEEQLKVISIVSTEERIHSTEETKIAGQTEKKNGETTVKLKHRDASGNE
jgi:hypothetical protein